MDEPKYKVGQRIYALWYGGRITSHIINSIESTEYGYWYSWINTYSFGDFKKGNKNGLHEKNLFSNFREAEQTLEIE